MVKILQGHAPKFIQRFEIFANLFFESFSSLATLKQNYRLEKTYVNQ